MPITVTLNPSGQSIRVSDTTPNVVDHDYGLSQLESKLTTYPGGTKIIELIHDRRIIANASNNTNTPGYGNTILGFTDPQDIQGAIADLIGKVGGSGAGQVTSYDLGETQTSATGTNWVALASGATSNVTLINRTGTSVDYRKAGTSVFISLADKEDVLLPVLANSSEWEIKRTDNSNAQVTVKFLRFA
jgi:hypothetical protein